MAAVFMKLNRLGTVVVLAALLLSPWTAAQVPAENQAPLILRILAFDRKVGVRASDGVRIALVYRPGHSESEAVHKQMLQHLGAAARKNTVAGQTLTLVSLPAGGGLEAELKRVDPVALYVCPGLEDAVGTLSRAARAGGMLTFTAVEGYVRDGLSVALVRRGAKISILINLDASRQEDADLDSRLLQIAEVIR